MFTITDADSPPTYHILDQLNIEAKQYTRMVAHINWAEIEEDYEGGLSPRPLFPSLYAFTNISDGGT